MWRSAVMLVVVGALAGCGNSRTPLPDLNQPVAPRGFRTLRLRQAGVAITVPRDWGLERSKPPLVAVIASGSAVVAVWSFTGSAVAPSGRAELRLARRELVQLSQQRDRSLELISSQVSRVQGSPAVELDALERIGVRRRRVRSIHLFLPAGQVVLEQYAPPSLFHAVDRLVFSPVKRSVRLLGAPGGMTLVSVPGRS